MPNATTTPARLHCVTDDLRTFYVSPDIVRALKGTLCGKVYRVQLHALPTTTFHVEAQDADQAHARAVAVVRAERQLPQTGATVQRMPENSAL
jgi:hypothetical protein